LAARIYCFLRLDQTTIAPTERGQPYRGAFEMDCVEKIAGEIKAAGEPKSRAEELLRKIAAAFEQGSYSAVTAALIAEISDLHKDFESKLRALEKKL
jgi:hypothetical protein